MFKQQDGLSATRPTRRIHGAVVIASWGIAASWIAFEILNPPHRTEAVLWRASVALALTAGASCFLVIWYLIRAQIEPVNDERTAFRIGYRCGYVDRDEKQQPDNLYPLPTPRSEGDRINGTGTSYH